MRVPDYVLKCCGFIAEFAHDDPTGGSFDLVGTGFFVATQSKAGPGRVFFTFVTAKHIIEDSKNTFHRFVVNAKSGGVVVVDGVSDHWFFHPSDPTADVAAMPVNMPPQADIRSLADDAGLFLTPELIMEYKLGIGDEVFMPDLFTYAPGNSRATPLLRYGNLAMLPDGPIQIESSFAEVYLVEGRSIGGISGSPVFIRETLTFGTHDEFEREIRLTGVGPNAYLLGLAHGHWDIRESDLNKPSFIHDRQRGVNLGIAVIVPAHKILETVHHPELVAIREEVEQHYGSSTDKGSA